MIEIVPNWHPLFVHFTLALFLLSTLLFVGSMLIPSASIATQWKIVARWNLWFGAGFTFVTVLTGVIAYNSVTHDEPSHLAMTDHRNWALLTALVFFAIAAWSAVRARAGKAENGLLVVALLAASILLLSTAWRGGEIVYRYGLGVMSLPKSDAHGHVPGEADDHHKLVEGDNKHSSDTASGHHEDAGLGTHTHADGVVENH